MLSPRHPALSTEVKWDMPATILTGMGMGFLLPWNGFMLAADYFEEIYPNQHTETTFASVNMVSLFGCMFFVVLYGTRLPLGCRIVTGFSVLFTCLMLAIPVTNLGVHCILVSAVGLGDALTQGSVFAFAGQLSPLHTGAVMMGNGASGLIVSFLRMGTKAAFPTIYGSFVAFFLLCAIQIGLCLVGWLVLRNHPAAQALDRTFDKNSWKSCLALCFSDAGSSSGGSAGTWKELDEAGVNPDDEDDLAAMSPSQSPKVNSDDEWMGINVGALKRVFDKIQVPGMCVFLNFMITLSVFPGVTVDFVSSLELGSWYPVLLISTFNGCDMIGRMIAAYYFSSLAPTKRYTIRMTLCRLVLLPFFILSVHPRWFASDLFGFALLTAFGLSNGYCATLAMVLAPTLVEGDEDKELSSMEMVFLLMLGLSAGAFTGSFIAFIFDSTGYTGTAQVLASNCTAFSNFTST